MPRNCWTRCNKTFPCSFPAREKTREIESRETSRCLEKQAILALLRKMIYKLKIIEEISDRELNDRCKRHIAIKATDPQKALIVLEETLHTDSFKLMPDGMIRLYDYLDDMEKVAAALSDAHILVTGLSVAGDTLEDYFLSKIGGTGNVKSPKS